MAETVETKDGKTLYYYPARGNGKNLLAIITYCRELGMTDDEIRELFDKAIKNMEG